MAAAKKLAEGAPKKLMPEVAEKFSVLPGHGVGEYHVYPHGIVHLDRIDLARASELVEGGFPYLVANAEVKGESEKAKGESAGADQEA